MKTKSAVNFKKEALKGILNIEDKNVLSYNLSYPVILSCDNLAQTKKINAFMLAAVTEKVQLLGKFMTSETKKHSKNILWPTVVKSMIHAPCNSNGIISFVTSYLIQTSPEDFGVTRESYTFDASSARLIFLKDVLKKRGLCERNLFLFMAKQIRRMMREGEDSFFENWDERLLRYYNDMNFFLAQDSFAVFYPPSTLRDTNLPTTFYIQEN